MKVGFFWLHFFIKQNKNPLGDIILKYIVLVLTFNCFPATMSKWVFLFSWSLDRYTFRKQSSCCSL